MSSQWKRGLSLAGVVMIALLMVGCNTMEGLGKDIQGLGRTLEGKAADNAD